MSELLLGCGSNWSKKVSSDGDWSWKNLTTVDINPNHKPDIIWNIECIPLPFEDNSFDEIHAYEVWEHTGQQGDYRFFFDQFSDYWRILKPGGYICGSCPLPNNVWSYGDPGHKRQISRETFHFLNQENYTNEIGKTTMSDYRFCYKADFKMVASADFGNSWWFVLKAFKPSRISI